MIAAQAEPLWAVFLNGVVLVGGFFGLLYMSARREFNAYWARFGRAISEKNQR